MNDIEFLEEVNSSTICPENFNDIYAEFQHFQKAALNTLIEFARVCEKNDINYQLASGSLLGIIRDGGQIPWDYDIDVFVPWTEKSKLLAALDKDLDSKYYYYCPEKDEKCRHVFIRLAPIEYRTEALHVDVFFLIGTPEEHDERKKFQQRVKKISELRYGKLVNLSEESMGSYKRFLVLLLKMKIPSMIMSLTHIQREYYSLCESYPLESSTFWIDADTYADWFEFPANIMNETRLINSQIGEFRIPVHYKQVLELQYGNYNEIPPLNNRVEEVMNNYQRIKRFQGYSEREK